MSMIDERAGSVRAARRALPPPPWVPIRRPGVSSYILDDDLVLHQPENDQVFVLNRTAAQIWSLCDGTRPASVIARELVVAHALSHERAVADVRDILAEFRRGDLIAAS
jgi:pyrroloquinoline quinone biosynthesis protein D